MQGKNVIDCATAAPRLPFFPVNIRLYITVFLYLATQKSGGVLCYTLRTIWVSVRLSVRASFSDSNLSSFWPIFFNLCMDFDIREEWFGMAMGFFFCQF